MSWTLFKTTLKANWILALVFTLILLIYVTTSASMFDPESAETMEAMLELVPDYMARAMGFVNFGTDLTQYLGNYLYGFIMIIFPLIYCVILANRLIAKHVDSGSMAYLLTTPTTRVEIAATQAAYLVGSLAVVLAISVAVAIGIGESVFPGMLDIPAYLMLNLVTYLTLTVAAGIGFLSSCAFSQARHSLAFGAGIPVLFFVFRMVSEIGEETSWLRYFTVFSFIDVEEILAGSGFALVAIAVLLPLALILFGAGVWIFDRRSLAL